jgi:hypothetical protein
VEGRVVDAHLEVAVDGGQARQQLGVFQGKQLVGDHAHAHPTPGRGQQLVEQQAPGVVVDPDEGLDVDAALGGANQVHAEQGILAQLQHIDEMDGLAGPAGTAALAASWRNGVSIAQ